MARVEFKELRDEIEMKLRESEEVHRKSDNFAEEVERHWRMVWASLGPHPYETGAYEASITVIKTYLREKQGRVPKGMRGPNGERPGTYTSETLYSYSVGSDHPEAMLIEYGTGPDINGVGSWYGPHKITGKMGWHKTPNTPTRAFHPAAKTVLHFHGTM